MQLFHLKACPKCGGDLIDGQDNYGAYVSCLQCGYDGPVAAPVPEKSNGWDWDRKPGNTAGTRKVRKMCANGCNDEAYSRGYCANCYARVKYHEKRATV